MDDQNQMNSFSTLWFENENLVECEPHPFDFDYNLNTVRPVDDYHSNNVTTVPDPFLEVVTQPVERFRFRYSSESAHGALGGTQKKTYPTVKLHNFYGPNLFVRCTLWCHENDQPHPFSLKLISKREPKRDPTICRLNDRNEAVFSKLSINCIQKSKYAKAIRNKIEALREDGIICEENDLNERVRLIESTFDPNKVRLRFDAFIATADGKCTYICNAFSNVIFNSKCTKTSELKIERLNICSGSVYGGEEMFLCVEKVDRKDVKVRFFQLDEEENEVWSHFAKIVEVHHQYTLIIKTPPYGNLSINRSVEVFLELWRPSDNTRSEKRSFKYLPPRKRKADILDSNSFFNDEKNVFENVDLEQSFQDYTQFLNERSTSSS